MIASKSRLFLCAALLGQVVAAPLVHAYINGGDFRVLGGVLVKKIADQGWAVSSAGRSEPLDKQILVNQLVAEAASKLPRIDAVLLSVDDKREIAKLAKAAIEGAQVGGPKVLKEGRVGAFRFQVGVDRFETYWETNDEVKRKTYERSRRFVPFVALKLEEAESDGN